jgi:hypothetical protein
MSQQRESLPRICKTLWSPAEFKGRRLFWAGGLLSTVSSNIKLESDYESDGEANYQKKKWYRPK